MRAVPLPEKSQTSSPLRPRAKLPGSLVLALKSASVKTTYPPAEIVVGGIMNFIGVLKSSLRNQPPMFTAPAVGLYSSIASANGSE